MVNKRGPKKSKNSLSVVFSIRLPVWLGKIAKKKSTDEIRYAIEMACKQRILKPEGE